MKTASLEAVSQYCFERTNMAQIRDFAGAMNGLQCENKTKTVSKIGVAVDAGLRTFERAAKAKADFLLVHHGLFWRSPYPFTGAAFRRICALVENNIALFSAHLPLDVHPEIGNNAILARELGLKIDHWDLDYEGTKAVAMVVDCPPLKTLKSRLKKLFPKGFVSVEKGPARPRKMAIISGSGASAVDALSAAGVDTLLTGELRQAHFSVAEDENLNLLCCGHYATEVFGVRALARELSRKFSLPAVWLESNCPL